MTRSQSPRDVVARLAVPPLRVRTGNDLPPRADGELVLYWMIAFRRTQWNFGLQRAAWWAAELQKPLVIFEPLRIGYRWASDRLHRFVIDGMADNSTRLAATNRPGVLYYPYVEPSPDADKGLLAAWAERACVVVTDDFPTFFLPRMIRAAAAKLKVRFELVDSNGLLPMRATERVFTTAYSFRAYLQKELRPHLDEFPLPEPLAGLDLPSLAMPGDIARRWPPASPALLAGKSSELARLPIDHGVGVVGERGGATRARTKLRQFLDEHVAQYAEMSNQPERDGRSGLSAYMHFGHLSAHEMFHELMSHQQWSPTKLSERAGGRREGWWGASPGAEAWLDQFITWREIGFNLASHTNDYDQYESLPEWSRATLEKRIWDPREHVYSLEEFAAARTHDPLWNAAQRQLLREGRIHNYLRMLWGKKILEWTASPRDALDVMIELNNRYALDGRDPNSYSGIFWTLGRYDRPWGPARPIFGTVRYMSSQSTLKKLRLADYLQSYGPEPAQPVLFEK